MLDLDPIADQARPASRLLTAAGARVHAGVTRLRERPEARRVLLFSVVLAIMAVVGYVALVRGITAVAVPVAIPWPIAALAFLAAESKVIVVHFRRETHSFSLSEAPAVMGLFFLAPNDYLLAMLCGSLVALVFAARQSALKVVFNLSNFAVIGVIELVVFHRLGQLAGPPSPQDWIAAFAATLIACVVCVLAIATAISLSGGAPQFQKLPEMIRFGGMVALANTSLALLAVSVMWTNPSAVWLLIIPLTTVFLAYQAYLSEREKHERLELLYQSSRILQHSPEVDSALVALLDHARQMFRAEVAEVVLFARGSGDAVRTTSVHDGPPEAMIPVDVDRQDLIHRRLETNRRAFFEGPGAGPLTSGREVRQAMMAPLVGESGMIGSLVIADRLTEGTRFEDDDLRLLETLANQAAVALENGQLEQSLAELSRLKEQLRYQAYHDPLTGLANRLMFTEQVDFRLSSQRDGRRLVVLFLDLDDFKVVNDTLGHAAGDRLLAAIAERIKGCIRSDDLAARLGGDEFAILLEDDAGLDRAMPVATRIIDALQVSLPILGQEIEVGGSIGIAVARGSEVRADELLRNADVAMYTAKAGGKRRVAVFDPTMHAAIVARHALSAELSRSIARGELAVFYQPIVELATTETVGVEALVRWHHPTRGLIVPDEFVPLAEENGTILALGRWVMSEACTQAAVWIREGGLPEGFSISVNLSSLQVQQTTFIDEIEEVLAATGLPAERLVLELTETAMFQDTQATIAKLETLRARGVRVALDDFGTGYSSLGYLRRFPIDILKIARDFVVPADREPAEWAFAHAIVALGQTLDLRIVAEGIEDAGQAARLRQLGCQYGQGYHFGRPVDRKSFEATLRGADTVAPLEMPVRPVWAAGI